MTPELLTANEQALLGLLLEHLREYRKSHLSDDYQLPNYQSGIITGMGMVMNEVERLAGEWS